MAQLNDLIVNGYSRFLNSAYGNLNGSATSALCAAYAASTNTAIKVKNAGTADYATSAGAAPFISHNHNYQLSGNGTAVNVSAGINFKPSGSNVKFYVSGNDIYISAKNDNTTYTTANFITANKTAGVSSNGTNVGTVNLSAISFSAGSNVALGTAANNIITITAKDTTYTSLNSINSTEYNALTSTSANSRNPNAHQLSSHTNFSAYFNATSANSALTSKSALSAGSASTAEKASWVSKSDNRNYNVAFSLDNAFNYRNTLTFNPSSNTLSSTNISSTSITGVSISGTTIIGDKGKFLSAEATTAIFNNTSSINLSGTNITATTFSGNLSGSAASALTSKSALTAGYASTTNTAIKVNSAIYLQDFGDTSRYVQVSWGGQDVSSVKIGAGASRNNGTQYLAAFYTNDGSTTSNIGKIKPVDASHVQVASADTVDGLHVATGTIGTATNYLYFC